MASEPAHQQVNRDHPLFASYKAQSHTQTQIVTHHRQWRFFCSKGLRVGVKPRAFKGMKWHGSSSPATSSNSTLGCSHRISWHQPLHDHPFHQEDQALLPHQPHDSSSESSTSHEGPAAFPWASFGFFSDAAEGGGAGLFFGPPAAFEVVPVVGAGTGGVLTGGDGFFFTAGCFALAVPREGHGEAGVLLGAMPSALLGGGGGGFGGVGGFRPPPGASSPPPVSPCASQSRPGGGAGGSPPSLDPPLLSLPLLDGAKRTHSRHLRHSKTSNKFIICRTEQNRTESVSHVKK